MSPSPLSGKVQTVLGPIDPEDLGITLTHEHLLIHFRPRLADPLEDLGWVMTNWSSSYQNLGLYDEGEIIQELSRYHRCGGQSLVEAGVNGIGRDPLGLARISRATGLNIIMGSGYYGESFQPSGWRTKREEETFEEVVFDCQT